MKTILLTGATGFLGSNILKKILELDEYKVVILKRSFSDVFRISEIINRVKYYDIDLVPLENAFKDNEIEVVLHTATQYGRKKNSTRVFDMVESNLILPLKLLDLSKKYNAATFINTDTILDKRVSMYSLSKKQFRDWLYHYSSDMLCINVSIEHFYGSEDNESKFVSYIINSLIKKEEFIDLTHGEQKRDFVYIQDVVDAFLIIIAKNKAKYGLYDYEIGSGTNIRIKDFVLKVAYILKNNITQLNFGAISYRENEVMESKVDLNNIKALGWRPKVTLEEGLRRTIRKGNNNK
jgi:CDP-paratose synthetase